MSPIPRSIRVLVVDDSALMRKLIPHLLTADPEIQVVGTAMDGFFALKKIRDLKPDVVTLDMDMPRMDGLTTLSHIVEEYGTPVILVSSLTEKGAQLTFKALEMGAVDFVTKPKGGLGESLAKIAAELTHKVKAAAAASPKKLLVAPRPTAVPAAKKTPRGGETASWVVALGISTGGPNALAALLPTLPADYPAALLIVQHMPEGFTEMFATRLNQICALEVRQAQEGDLLLPRRVLIAPGNRHLKVKRLPLGSIAVLSNGPEVRGHRPSVDVLFSSVAQEFGPHTVGVLMTGMGEDGAEGLGEIRAAGGITLAQSEESCVVFGMPKAAIDRGYVQRVVSLEELPGTLRDIYVKGGREYDPVNR